MTENPTALLDFAAELADEITALVARLARDSQRGPSSCALTAASDVERRALLSLLEHDRPTSATCEQAARHLACLDRLLTLAVETSAESCRALADRLAVIEEFDVHSLPGAQASLTAMRLAQRLR